MNKPHITLMMTLWGRPEVFCVVCKVLQRFMVHADVRTDIVFVLSKEDPYYDRLLKIIKASDLPGYRIVKKCNDFLGAKHNSGIKNALMHRPDYIMNIGSDDLLHSSLWDLYMPFIKQKYHIIGLKKLYFYAPPSEAIMFGYKNDKHLVVGAGRLMHGGMIRKIWQKEGKLYDQDCQRGLDTNSAFRLYTHGVQPLVLDSGQFPMVVDIKTDMNINGMKRIKGTQSYNQVEDVSPDLLEIWFPELIELTTETQRTQRNTKNLTPTP